MENERGEQSDAQTFHGRVAHDNSVVDTHDRAGPYCRPAARLPEAPIRCTTIGIDNSTVLLQITDGPAPDLSVWFIGENAVVGVSVKAKAGVTLLFWNGQAFEDQSQIPVGQFKAAQISFQVVSEVNTKVLRRLLKKAVKNIWDFASIRKQRRG